MEISLNDTSRNAAAVTIAFALALRLLSAVPANAGPHDWATGLPGCAPSRPAVAHYAGGVPLVPQPTNGPVPCGMPTGWAAVENRIEVANDGTVIYMPVLLPSQAVPVPPGVPIPQGCGRTGALCLSNSVARTTDDGATWYTSTARASNQVDERSADVDNNLYVDHGTGRLFYYDYHSGGSGPPGLCANGAGATIFFSDDGGATWDNGFDLEHACSENPTILVGKPRISSPSFVGGVAYLCGNNWGSGVVGVGSTGKVCSKSLDGGATWLGASLEGGLGGGNQGAYSGQRKDQLHPYPECAGASSTGGNDVQPMPDGTLLVVLSCNGRTYLSRSRDEGASWYIQNQIPTGGSLRADSQGNLYKLNGSRLSTSTNGGRSWSAEKDVTAPDVVSRDTTFFAQGTHRVGHEVGRVAIMYYGIRTGQTTSDGFITETRNALDPNPVFWSGQVNTPTRPLLYNTPGANPGVTILDFIGGAFSPDGRSVWASYVQDCGTNMLTDPNCTSRWIDGITPGNGQDGFAGRLVWPSP